MKRYDQLPYVVTHAEGIEIDAKLTVLRPFIHVETATPELVVLKLFLIKGYASNWVVKAVTPESESWPFEIEITCEDMSGPGKTVPSFFRIQVMDMKGWKCIANECSGKTITFVLQHNDDVAAYKVGLAGRGTVIVASEVDHRGGINCDGIKRATILGTPEPKPGLAMYATGWDRDPIRFDNIAGVKRATFTEPVADDDNP